MGENPPGALTLHIIASSKVDSWHNRNDSWVRGFAGTDNDYTIIKEIPIEDLPLYIGWPHLSKDFDTLLQGVLKT
jgi:hypothetical protein